MTTYGRWVSYALDHICQIQAWVSVTLSAYQKNQRSILVNDVNMDGQFILSE
jgi:hypothetical protein